MSCKHGECCEEGVSCHTENRLRQAIGVQATREIVCKLDTLCEEIGNGGGDGEALFAEIVPLGQNNLNASVSGNRILWDSIAASNIPGLALGAPGNIELPAGTYFVFWEASMTSTGSRPVIGWRYEDGAVNLRQRSGGAYARSGSAPESGDNFNARIVLGAPTTEFGIDAFRQANPGSSTLVPEQSRLYIWKVS